MSITKIPSSHAKADDVDISVADGKALVLRSTRIDGQSHGGFQWPMKVGEKVTAPDWRDDGECSGGLHGLLDGWGDCGYLGDTGDLWWLVEVDRAACRDLGGKVKFQSSTVRAYGSMASMMSAIGRYQIGLLIGSSGDSARIGSSGDSARIGSSGFSAQIGSSGFSAQIGSSGFSAQIGSSGFSAQIGSSGDSAQIGSSGDSARIGSSGDSARIGSSGDSAQIGSSGFSARIGSSGDSARIGSSGDSAQIGSSGFSARIEVSGDDGVVACAGSDAVVTLGNGGCCAIPYHDGKRIRFAIGYVGENIKAGVSYRVNSDGEFVETEK